MALLSQFLVGFGTAAGRGSYYQVEATRHHANEFVVLVGPSGKGRKGSSWDHVESALETADKTFIRERVTSGLISGEGLISAVRDGDDGEEDGVEDKRLLVVESEFAQVMKVLAREGNTLSPVIRNAWDGRTLQTLARNSPLRSTDNHIGFVGHITKDELVRYLGATELANGFFNRFMVVAVKRSQELPFGGSLSDSELEETRIKIASSLSFAARTERVTFSMEARDLWIGVYGPLSRSEPGMLGAATGRAEAHVVRLSL